MSQSAVTSKSPEKQAVHAATLLLLFAIFSKAASFVKELVIAREFGISPDTDAYVLGFGWATWLPGIFVSVTMATIIPIGRNLRHRSSKEGDLFFNEFAGWTIIVGLAAGLLTAVAPTLLAGFPFWSSANSAVASLEYSLPIFAWLVPAAFVAAYCSARLVSSQRHSNLALEAVAPLVIVGYLLLAPTVTLIGLCLATVAGYACYAVATLVLLRWDTQSLRPAVSLQSSGWQELARASVLIVIGNVCAGSVLVADQFQASLLGEGSVATLGFASRLLLLPATMLSLIIARSMLPVFSDLSARDEAIELRRLVKRFASIAFAIGLLGAATVWLLAPWLVSIAFERGSFDADATRATTEALRWGIFQLPCFAAAMVVVQALLSQRRFYAVAFSGIFNLVAKLALNAWLGPLLGVRGITLATAIVLSVSFVILVCFLLQPSKSNTTK